METGSDNRFNADRSADPATNIGELHQTTAVAEQVHESTINSYLEAHLSTLRNNSGPLSSSPSSSSLSSQNPFLHLNDSDNIGNGGMMNNDSSSSYLAGSLGDTHVLGPHPSFAPSTHEPSTGNPFQEPPKIDNEASLGAFDSWKNQSFAYETAPTNIEPLDPLPARDQGHQDLTSSNLWTPFSESSSQEPIQVSINATNKSQIDTAESRDDDDHIPISSMPNHAHSGDVAAQHSPSASVVSSSNEEFGTINKGSEIQNPPVQVMERPGSGDFGASSAYVFPSHVFARNTTNSPGEWSTASNESLFSIHMGTMSFTSELMCFSKTELDRLGGDIYTLDPPNASPTQQQQQQQPQPQPQSPAPVSKFTDISQRAAELHEESAKVTEAKAAETMREVIMETSINAENAAKGNYKNQSVASQSSTDKDKSVAYKGAEEKQKQHKQPENAAKGDEQNQSAAPKLSIDKDKSVAYNGAQEKQKQQNQSEKQEETPNAVNQSQKPTTTNDHPKGGWLSCFSCCAFCQ